MINLSDTLELARSAGIFFTNVNVIRVPQQKYGLVGLVIDGRAVTMNTTKAHRTGFDMVKHAGEALHNEFVVLKINGVALNFPPKGAKKVGAALLRRADDADDYQRIN